MAIQYAGGTNVNATLTQVAGTRAELAQWIRDQLIVAGWTSSGSATDYQLTSATTPGGLSGRARVYDPGSGSCARIKMSNVAGTRTQAGDLFLLPAVGASWRIVANKYQFFVFSPGVTTSRKYAAGGVLYTPTGFGATEAIWGECDSQNDTDATVRKTFRTTLGAGYVGASMRNWVGICNGSVGENNNNSSSGTGGSLQIYGVGGTVWSNSGGQGVYRYQNGDPVVDDAELAWGLTGGLDEPKINGQLWDAHLYAGSYTPDAFVTLDGKQWISVTGGNGGSTGLYSPGTLMIYAP